jgi:hypothetical protein
MAPVALLLGDSARKAALSARERSEVLAFVIDPAGRQADVVQWQNISFPS